MGKQTVAQPCSGIPVSNKKEWTIDTSGNMSEYRMQYAFYINNVNITNYINKIII